MQEWTTKIFLPDPEAATRLGQRFAPLLSAGDCLLLSGSIGAGKSHFARAIIQARLSAAGRNEDVPSPTFTLVQTYFDGQEEIWHSDLYRLADSSEVEELGLTEAFSMAITLVEWPDRLGGLEPTGALYLLFETDPKKDGRWLSFSSNSQGWRSRIEDLLQRRR